MSDYLKDIYAPVDEERTVELELDGELPAELRGMYVRNSPNPRYESDGRHHWFDGDGMVHGVEVDGGSLSYRNRYIRTTDFQRETDAGEALWRGIMEPFDPESELGSSKNTANTDIVEFDGDLLATWWLGGEPYRLRIPDLETLGTFDFRGTRTTGVGPHPKIDPRTGELIFYDFRLDQPPFLTYGVVGKDGTLKHVAPIEMPGPRLFHDIALTENYSIVIDLPMVWDPEALAAGRRIVRFHPELPTRFGVLPRYGTNDDIRWFETEPCYIFHAINAWEEGDEIVLDACRVENPMPFGREWDRESPRLEFIQLDPYPFRWRLDLSDGSTTREQWDDVPSEFPRINDDWLGRASRYSYHPRIASEPTLLFDALIKYDTEVGTSSTFEFGEGRFADEAVFVPRPGSEAEDDGWLVTFVHDAREDETEFVVLRADDVAKGPIVTATIPGRVPIGFHAAWADLPEA